MVNLPFESRVEGGGLLAEELKGRQIDSRAVIFALTRGGVSAKVLDVQTIAQLGIQDEDLKSIVGRKVSRDELTMKPGALRQRATNGPRVASTRGSRPDEEVVLCPLRQLRTPRG